ncbi:MAG: hypothetical protein ACOCWG_00210 [bacterium]
MEIRKHLKLITDIAEEASLNLPIEEIESTDNSELIKFTKFQLFQAKSRLYKEIGAAKIEAAKTKVKDELERLANLSLAELQEKMVGLMPQTQFRNLEQLDKGEILKLIEDSLILDNMLDDKE